MITDEGGGVIAAARPKQARIHISAAKQPQKRLTWRGREFWIGGYLKCRRLQAV